jgi:hypothetical protein
VAEFTASTTYARLTRRQARCIMACVVLVMVGGAVTTLSPLGSSNFHPERAEASDVALYRAEVDRISHGESYYEAAARELAARGYPTRSVFNWRMPLPMWLLGKLPNAALG